MEQLHSLLPYVLAFVPKIKTVTVIDTIKKTSKNYQVSKREVIHNDLEKVVIELGDASNIKNYLLAKEGETVVAMEFLETETTPTLCSTDSSVPKLFFSFPLVGSQDFCFPIVLNNSNKNEWIPRTEREGVDLGEQDEAGQKNRKVIEKGGKAYLKIIKYAASNNWNNLHLLAQIPSFQFEREEIKEWFKKQVWEGVRATLLDSKIVKTQNGNIKLSQLLIPYHETTDDTLRQEITENLYQLLSVFDKTHDDTTLSIKDRLPLSQNGKSTISDWLKVLDFRRFPNVKYTWNRLIDDVSEAMNFATLDKQIEGDTWEWMNCFIDNLLFLKYEFNSLKAIFPNQEEVGAFCEKQDLYSDRAVKLENKEKEILKDLLLSTGKDIRKQLIHNDIIFPVIDDDERQLDLEKSFISPLNSYIQKQPFETYKSLIFKLISYIPVEENLESFRTTIYKTAKPFLGKDLKEQEKVKGLPSSLWVEADKELIDAIANTVKETSLKQLSKKLPHLEETETALSWHQTFIQLIANEIYRSQLENKALLPNQTPEGEFKKIGKLFIDKNLQDPLKIGLAAFGDSFDWRTELLDKRYSSFFPEGIICEMFFGKRSKDNKKASERINHILQNRDKKDYQSATIKPALLQLIRFTYSGQTQEDTNRRKLYDFASVLFPNMTVLQPTYLTDMDWSEIKKVFLFLLAEKVAEIGSITIEHEDTNSLPLLSQYISQQQKEIDVIVWLNSFTNFVYQHAKELSNAFAILPNREGDFCLTSGLNNGFDFIQAEKGIGIIPEPLLIALKQISNKPSENWNTVILHPNFSYPLNTSITTSKVCNHIESLLVDDKRGYSEEGNIQEGVLSVKEYIDELDKDTQRKLFPHIHQDIYKMALSAMDDVAKYATKIPKEMLKHLSTI